MAARKQQRTVLVTTQHRGVFVGQTTDPGEADPITLTGVRMVIYWSADSHGVLGLAKKGVTRAARVSPAVDRAVLRNVTGVFDVTPDAAKTFDSEPWG